MPLYLHPYCESSSVGRARPCQGRGRGFESRLSLKCGEGHIFFSKYYLRTRGGIGRHATLRG